MRYKHDHHRRGRKKTYPARKKCPHCGVRALKDSDETTQHSDCMNCGRSRIPMTLVATAYIP